MTWRFVKQPNGLYARFSETSNSFTHKDLTRIDALKMARAELGEHGAGVKVDRADEHPERWAEAQALIATGRKG